MGHYSDYSLLVEVCILHALQFLICIAIDHLWRRWHNSQIFCWFTHIMQLCYLNWTHHIWCAIISELYAFVTYVPLPSSGMRRNVGQWENNTTFLPWMSCLDISLAFGWFISSSPCLSKLKIKDFPFLTEGRGHVQNQVIPKTSTLAANIITDTRRMSPYL